MKYLGLILLFAMLSACVSSSRNPASTATTYDFIKGLQSSPGSIERVRAGQQLQEIIERYYREDRLSKDPEARREQERSKKIFNLTTQYMMAPQTCKASEKVRLYRGVGQIPIVRPQTGPENAVALFGDLTGQVYSGLVNNNLVEKYGDPELRRLRGKDRTKDLGEIAGQNLQMLGLDLDRLKWASLFGWERTNRDDEKLEGRFDLLGSAHTNNSAGSPLVSTSLLSSVAEQYGPTILVLDVCPERVFPAFMVDDVFSTFWESEMYVPFFIFPEEIVRIERRECLLAQMNEGPAPASCSKEFTDRDYKANERTLSFRRIFFNYGYKFERIFISFLIDVIDSPSAGAELRGTYHDKKDRFYELLDQKALSLNQWRQELEKLNYTGRCEVAKEVYSYGKVLIKLYRDNISPGGDWAEDTPAQEYKSLMSRLDDAEQYRQQYKKDLSKECKTASW